jgi:DNA-binding beta-propeller fold protein YncE
MKRLTSRLHFVLISFILFLSCTLEPINPPCPSVTTTSPVAAHFGDLITIKGNGFEANNGHLYKVRIAGQIIDVPEITVPDANTLIFRVPRSMPSGPLTLTVGMSPDCSSTQSIDFTYYYTATMVSKLLAGLNAPAGLDLDMAENVVVADRSNHRIYVIKPNDNTAALGQIEKTHGSGSSGCQDNNILESKDANFRSPSDVDVDLAGNIFVTEESISAVIRLIRPAGSVEVYAGKCNVSGTAPGNRKGPARLNLPLGLIKDGNDIYFTDAGIIRKIDVLDDVKNLSANPASGYFRGIEVSKSRVGAGPIFVTDEAGKTIKSVELGGSARNIDFSPNLLSRPAALALDSKGNIFIADRDKHQIYVIYNNGKLEILAGTGDAAYVEDVKGTDAKFNGPAGIVLNEKKAVLYVSDTKNQVVRSIKIE